MTSPTSASFVRQAHHIVHDLFRARPQRYFADFLVTTLIAAVALAVYLRAPAFTVAQAAAFIVCGLALYRAVVFTHEIEHRRRGTFVGFTWLWNTLCGVPLLVPSFLYGDHGGHHMDQSYGTWSDPEYILRSRRWQWRLLIFLLLPLVYPLGALLRFLVLTPVALLSRPGDRLVWRYASSLFVMNEAYRREYDGAATTISRWAQELACMAWVWLVTSLLIAGRLPWSLLPKVYLVMLFWLALNQLRTLVAHRYTTDPDSPGSHVDQLLDTNTYPHGKLLPALWAPLGLRYHALHHLLPMLPYHSMRAAHDRLIAELPGGSPYHRTVRPGLWPVLKEMVRDRKRHAQVPRSPAAAILTEGRRGSR